MKARPANRQSEREEQQAPGLNRLSAAPHTDICSGERGGRRA